MSDILKKILQFFVGLFYIGRDKTKEVIGTLEKEGVFDEKNSREVVDSTVKDAKDKLGKTTDKVKETIDKIKKKGEEEMIDSEEEDVTKKTEKND